ncbi:MAG TPA: septal ring lytic transglycosylase RlpA family protein [Bacteroidota bacterium]
MVGTYRESTLRFRIILTAVCCLFVLFGCSSSVRFTGGNTTSGGGSKRVSEEKTPDGSKIVRVNPGRVLLTLEGVASYYADDFHGKLTSNGEIFNMHDLTAAHRTFPSGTKVRVTNLENGKIVNVRVNDRGPFVDGRIIDLSLGAAKEIDMVQKGTTRVKIEVLEWGDGKYVGQGK